RLGFSAPVALAEVERRARLVLVDGKTVAVRARYRRERSHTLVLLEPAAPLPRGPDVRLVVDAGLVAEDARPPLPAPVERLFETVATLGVYHVGCPTSPRAPLRFGFSEEVDPKALARELRVEPAV